MFDYASLAALAAVVQEGSFERAALRLHVTPSAVSQRVRALEERMGCALIVRGQPCSPTATGQRLCHHLDHVRLLEHDLQDTLPGNARDTDQRLRLPLAVNADSLATWLAPALATFAAQAPVLLDIAVDDQDHTQEWLRSGAVLAAVSGNPVAAAGCNSQRLGSMRYLAVASPEFVARYFGSGVRAAQLARAPSLVFNSKDALQARWVRRLVRRPVDMPQHRVPSPEAFVIAACLGMGWGLQPVALIAAHLRDGRLVELVPGTALDVPLYWQQARVASKILQELTAHILATADRTLLHAGSAASPVTL